MHKQVNVFDWPGDLVDLPDIERLTEAVLAVEVWTRSHLEQLDYVYRNRVVYALDSRAGLDVLRALNEHLRRAAAVVRGRAEIDASCSLFDNVGPVFPYAVAWAARWQGYAAVVSARISGIESADPEKVLGFTVVKRLVAELRQAGDLGVMRSLLGTRASETDHFLAQMVRHRMAEIVDVGGVKIVYLGDYFKTRGSR